MKTTDILPTEFQPRTVEDFVGPAKDVARRLANSAKMCLKTGAPAAHLLVGATGSGKTSLADFLIEAFEINKWNISEYFGADITKEVAQEITYSLRLTSLYPGFRCFKLDEFDKCTKEARDRLLEMIGERKQPRKTVIVATSNMTIADFDALERNADARGRLSSRFQVHEVPQPTKEDVIPLLELWLPTEQARNLAQTHATSPNGETGMPINTRALLKDCTSLLQA